MQVEKSLRAMRSTLRRQLTGFMPAVRFEGGRNEDNGRLRGGREGEEGGEGDIGRKRRAIAKKVMSILLSCSDNIIMSFSHAGLRR